MAGIWALIVCAGITPEMVVNEERASMIEKNDGRYLVSDWNGEMSRFELRQIIYACDVWIPPEQMPSGDWILRWQKSSHQPLRKVVAPVYIQTHTPGYDRVRDYWQPDPCAAWQPIIRRAVQQVADMPGPWWVQLCREGFVQIEGDRWLFVRQ